ncbi:PREDICTED: uncharacterized protein DDB_G0292186-like [Trachymyrmex cornetzi]|uniref:uncharacterized protein DDB_G0292186-like n=1 Tax=Trachymyrmex cornetzi TaxID=471704 RepID=UPI00084F05AB|nr:PREDICTED: uncharacterized protein DDB_G0292186-like [Trachymyrmex cornetzi]
MKQLILFCLLSPAIFAWSDKTENFNNDPFPTYPEYPYNHKLKRGTETEENTQLTSELYAPKVDAKDTYSSSYSNNYQRDPYNNPNYNPYLTNSTSSFVNPTYYNGGDLYVYAPYPAYNSYPASYAVNPMSPYPNYYYQPPYYYTHYFNHGLFPPPPPPPAQPQPQSQPQPQPQSQPQSQPQPQPQSQPQPQPQSQPQVYPQGHPQGQPQFLGVFYQETPQVPIAEDDKQDKKVEKEETSQDAQVSHFVDGGNYIAGNSRDLDVQSSTYKAANPYNQLAQNVQVKNLPISSPKVTYKVINVEQLINQDYQPSTAYVNTQQIEQTTSQAFANLLGQQQVGNTYDTSRDALNGANDGSYGGSYENQNVYNSNAASYVSLPDAGNKAAAAYVIDSVGIPKVNRERTKQSSSTQRASSKSKYSNTRKPGSRNHSQVSYTSPESGSNHRAHAANARLAGQTDKYGSYDASQNYDGTYSQTGHKQEQNYGTYQNQAGSYQNEGFTTAPQTTRSYIYQYSAYDSDQQVQQQQQDEINGKFGAKQ